MWLGLWLFMAITLWCSLSKCAALLRKFLCLYFTLLYFKILPIGIGPRIRTFLNCLMNHLTNKQCPLTLSLFYRITEAFLKNHSNFKRFCDLSQFLLSQPLTTTTLKVIFMTLNTSSCNILSFTDAQEEEAIRKNLLAKKKVMAQKQRDLKALVQIGQDHQGCSYYHLLQELKGMVQKIEPLHEQLYGKPYTHKTCLRQSQIHYSIKHTVLIADFQSAGIVLRIEYDKIAVEQPAYVQAFQNFDKVVKGAHSTQKMIEAAFDTLLSESKEAGKNMLHFDPVYLTKKQLKYINFQAYQAGIKISFTTKEIFPNKEERMQFLQGLQQRFVN